MAGRRTRRDKWPNLELSIKIHKHLRKSTYDFKVKHGVIDPSKKVLELVGQSCDGSEDVEDFENGQCGDDGDMQRRSDYWLVYCIDRYKLSLTSLDSFLPHHSYGAC